jgi:phosphatidylinositol glycan class S
MSTSTHAIPPVEAAEKIKEDVKTPLDDAPPNAVVAEKKKKEPPVEKPESIRLRGMVILSFWAIVIVLGLPIWWRTTAIYRAKLPLDEMMDWAEGRVCLQTSLHFQADLPRLADQSSHFEYL